MDLSEREALEKVETELAKDNLRGQWAFEAAQQAAKDGPPPLFPPKMWKWDAIERHLVELKHAIPESMNIRRNVSFMNGNLRGTTQTMVMGVQMLKPGESAWGHRHVADALRFVVKSTPEMYTVVAGEICPMEPYDLIRTPAWRWHDHFNASPNDVAWVDIVDSPVVTYLNQQFYADLGDKQQPRRNTPAPPTGSEYRPVWGAGSEAAGEASHIPSYRYAWKEVEPRLKDLAKFDGNPCDGAVLEYCDRETGGSTFTRMTCWAQMLRPGEHTRAHRHTYSSCYFVIRGEGKSIIDGHELHWKQHDMFVVPNWCWHEHINLSKGDEAMLFATHDKPLTELIQTYREEVRQ